MVSEETDVVFIPFSQDFVLDCKPIEEQFDTSNLIATIARKQLGSCFDNVLGVEQKLFQQLAISMDGLVSVRCLENGTSHIAHVVSLKSALYGNVQLSPVLASNLHMNMMEKCHISIETMDSRKTLVAREVTIARVSFVVFDSSFF